MAFKYIKREWQNGKWRYWYKDDAMVAKNGKQAFPEERANDKTENAKDLAKTQKEREEAAKKAARDEKIKDALGYDKKEELEKAAKNLEIREQGLKKNADINATKQHENALASYEAAKLAYDKTAASKIEKAKAYIAKQQHVMELKAKTTYPEERATDFTEDPEYLKAKKKAANNKAISDAWRNEVDNYHNAAKKGKQYVLNLFK